MNNLITIKNLSKNDIDAIFKKANHFKKNKKKSAELSHAIIANLFFEPSTRTLNSFEIAEKKLGALVISPNLAFSSLQKGESLLDTVNTFIAMGVDLLVIRHQNDDTMSWLTKNIFKEISIINAGEGKHQHPTQTLLDLFTIQEHKNNWSDLKITLIGDSSHSRVANSLIDGLEIMGVKNITVVAPKELCIDHNYVNTFTDDLSVGCHDADVIMCLRLQSERLEKNNSFQNTADYKAFCLNSKLLKLAKPDAIVMHPGPMNRNQEISDEVADGKQSVILQQVENGVYIRMACLSTLLTKK